MQTDIESKNNITNYFFENFNSISKKHLIPYIKNQRWFRSKNKEVINLEIDDYCINIINDKAFIIIYLKVLFKDNESETYFFPLAISSQENQKTITKLNIDSKGYYIFDSLCDQDFVRWLIDQVNKSKTVGTKDGTITFTKKDNLLGLDSLNEIESKTLSAEQSNTSIVIQDKIIVKIFRKMEEETNPEVEMLSFINEHGFKNVPGFKGEITYKALNGNSTSTAIIQSFIKNKGDCWKYVLSVLEDLFSKSDHYLNRGDISKCIEKDYIAHLKKIERLGELTALLHVSLASNRSDSKFSPEKIANEDIINWKNYFCGLVINGINIAKNKIDSIKDEKLKQMVNLFLESKDKFINKSEAFSILEKESIRKIRFHGDYHLGQVLNTGSDFIIFDFEGEPLRNICERKLKNCALRDVAGMLRSFNYASYVSIKEKNNYLDLIPLKESWESLTRKYYLDKYFETCMSNNSNFVSNSKESNKALLSVMEIEKALYELNYELNNRPDWVHIPLNFLCQQCKK